MKKLILVMLMLAILPAITFAQLPSRWYSGKIVYVFNPYAEEPMTNVINCMCEITWDGYTLHIEDCDDGLFSFRKTSTLLPDYTEQFEEIYTWWTKEPSSGETWFMMYYTVSYELVIMLEDKSLMIIYKK